MAARAKACVSGCSLAGTAGSNFVGAWMSVMSVVCYQRSPGQIDPSSRGVLPSVVCLKCEGGTSLKRHRPIRAVKP